jgi:hypothetical protein
MAHRQNLFWNCDDKIHWIVFLHHTFFRHYSTSLNCQKNCQKNNEIVLAVRMMKITSWPELRSTWTKRNFKSSQVKAREVSLAKYYGYVLSFPVLKNDPRRCFKKSMLRFLKIKFDSKNIDGFFLACIPELAFQSYAWAFFFTAAAKFGAYGKIFSIAFVTFITDALEPCAALTSLTKFSLVFYLSASLNAFRLSPLSHITIVDFFDGQAMSPECHEAEPQEKSWLAGSIILGL